MQGVGSERMLNMINSQDTYDVILSEATNLGSLVTRAAPIPPGLSPLPRSSTNGRFDTNSTSPETTSTIVGPFPYHHVALGILPSYRRSEEDSQPRTRSCPAIADLYSTQATTVEGVQSREGRVAQCLY